MSYALFDSQMKDKIIIDNDDLRRFTAFLPPTRSVSEGKMMRNGALNVGFTERSNVMCVEGRSKNAKANQKLSPNNPSRDLLSFPHFSSSLIYDDEAQQLLTMEVNQHQCANLYSVQVDETTVQGIIWVC